MSASDYRQELVLALLENVAHDIAVEEPKNLGEIAPKHPRPPHIALFLRLSPSHCLGMTAGLAARPAPLPVAEGFQYFELCALTSVDSPRILWLLSNIGLFMLATASPMLYGEPQPAALLPTPKPFLPYQSLRFGGDDERFLFVPRWEFIVPNGPPVEMVEPLPITNEQWSVLAPLDASQRAGWVRSLGPRSVDQWSALLGRLG